jgi:hypothetical protein
MSKKIKKKNKKEDKLSKEIRLLTEDFFDYIKESSISELINNSEAKIMIYGLSLSGDIHSIEIKSMPLDKEGKEELFLSLGKRLANEVNDLIAFGFSSEVWMTIRDKKNDSEKNDVLLINVLNCSGLIRAMTFIINRILDGKVLGVSSDDDSILEINKKGWVQYGSDGAPQSSILETISLSYTKELIIEHVSNKKSEE